MANQGFFPDFAKINQELGKLTPDTKPLFGIMSAQHMVEHIELLVKISTEEIPMDLLIPEDKAAKIKTYLMISGNEISEGFKAPVIPVDDTLPLQYESLKEAISKLNESLSKFDPFFIANPTATPKSPVLGALTEKEWRIFHAKHFRHHFRQFGLTY